MLRDLSLTLVLIPMLVAGMRYVHTGTLVWLWTALAAPTALMWGFAASLPLNKIAVGATLIAFLVDRTKRRFVADSTFTLHTLFVAQGVIAYTFALTDIDRSYDLLDRMVKIWALTLFMRVANRDRLPIHALVLMIALSIGLHGALEGSKYILSRGRHIVVPISVLGDNNSFGLVELMTLPMIVYAFKYSRHMLVRVGFFGFGILVLVGVIASNSRGAVIGLAALTLMMIVYSRRRGLMLAVAIVLGLGLVMFAPQRWQQRMDTISAADNDSSFMSRVSSWKMNTLLALDRPLVGGGYSAMEDGRVFQMYRGEFGTLDFIWSPTPTGPYAAHSIYFEVLGDTGFVGLFLFLGMLGAWFASIRAVRNRTRGDPRLAWAFDLAAALQQSVVVYLVSGAALSVAYFEIVYVMLTLAAVLRRSVMETQGERAREIAAASAQRNLISHPGVGALLARRFGGPP